MKQPNNRTQKRHILIFTATASALAVLFPTLTACTNGKHTERPAPSPAPAITSFKAFPSPIRLNDTVILNAVFANGKGMVEPGGVPMSSGEPIKLKPDKDTTYTITVTNTAGATVSREAKVAVLPTGTPVLSLITEVPSLSDTPAGIAVDGSGNIYLSNSKTGVISTITAEGTERILAGKAFDSNSTDGPGEVARFRYPRCMTVDATGNLYISDVGNETIRKITPQGQVRTLAGVPGMGGTTDGSGYGGRFKYPWGLAVDGDGNVYVGDIVAHTIRKVTPWGDISTLAGKADEPGSEDGPGSTARFVKPDGIAVDTAGNVFVADRISHTIRKITPAGDVSTLAGHAGIAGSADGIGKDATFDSPSGLAVDKDGNIYVADSGNSTIRKITTAGMVSTIVGTPGSIETRLGPLPAMLNNPRHIAVDPTSKSLIISQPGSVFRVSF